ncbi:right-handed parallel beta-helix repeat-containing protein [Dyadobacter fanqingshengii]|uniref:Right-handed parallel beta-helix repeat-containing protein n=1 Tax=Dyadobacter fanqingshengii TaxID=2906443 RepID=A0A9X1TF22_9BACT|nr:right-handed parallel beta-helix repeat-containing protein [Dyadobacter fanqingshengii]MCF0039097.1 right-handed parallel beta-helix repeat-containing protein [Dyadobacter fanqingshengii]USJ34082.1 right-handed parallel beta-helix repeat-containing protein [Dyadobacter fanqingshengii]
MKLLSLWATLVFLQLLTLEAYSQRKVLSYDSLKHSSRVSKAVINLNIQKDFGAVPNDTINDHAAFQAASEFINRRKGNCVLIIPTGTYIVGKQEKLKNRDYFYRGTDVIQILNATNVTIRGEAGSKLKYDVGLRFGTFDPADGSSTNITMDCTPKTKTTSSKRADLGRCIVIGSSRNVVIENLELDGNFFSETLNNMNSYNLKCTGKKSAEFDPKKINIGGGYGDCGIQLAHYGVFVSHSGDVVIRKVTAKRFGLDGIQVANSHTEPGQKNVKIIQCKLDFNARTGLALTGGDKMEITGTSLTNTGGCMYASTGTGVDIEAQIDAKRKEKLVTNVKFTNCKFANNSSGEILAKFGLGSSNITFEGCDIKSSTRAINLGRKNTGYKFVNNRISGTKIILLEGQKIDIRDEVQSKSSRTTNTLRTSSPENVFQNNVLVD